VREEKECPPLVGGKSPGVKICRNCTEMIVAVFRNEELMQCI
jgi:hypothetical protein